MSRLRSQLLELGSYAEKHPGAKLIFVVPLSSLAPNGTAEAVSVKGDWTVAVAEGVELSDVVTSAGPTFTAEDGLEAVTFEMRVKPGQ